MGYHKTGFRKVRERCDDKYADRNAGSGALPDGKSQLWVHLIFARQSSYECDYYTTLRYMILVASVPRAPSFQAQRPERRDSWTIGNWRLRLVIAPSDSPELQIYIDQKEQETSGVHNAQDGG